MSSIYVQCALVFGGIFACLAAAMFCAWKATDALNRRNGARQVPDDKRSR